MLKPLFIDNDYQILNSASGQIARNFWEHQVGSDFQPTIVCTPARFDFKSKWKTIEVEDRYWIWYLGVGLRKFGLAGLSYLPDMHYFSWAKFVERRMIKSLNRIDFDYIHTLSAPQSTHLIGLKLKEITGKPWVAQFNDPWHDDCDHVYKFKCLSDLDLTLERKVIEQADIIIHTNHVLADMWMERYGNVVKDKMYVVPLNFNISNLPTVPEGGGYNSDERLNISHVGEIYSTRSSIDFLKGVSLLFNKYPELRQKLHVTFIGRVKSEDQAACSDMGLNDVIEYIPPMPPEDLYNHYIQSDVFLVIDVNQTRSPAFPSKLMMYHYYRKPIVGVTNPNSIIEEELKKSGHAICYYGCPEQVAEYLYRALTNYNSLTHFDKTYWETYTVENVSSLYKCLLSKHHIE